MNLVRTNILSSEKNTDYNRLDRKRSRICVLGERNTDKEIQWRRRLGWAVFGKLLHIVNNKMIPQHYTNLLV